MQPVSQLDQNHPDILGHGQDHFSDIICLLFFFAFIFDFFIALVPLYDYNKSNKVEESKAVVKKMIQQ